MSCPICARPTDPAYRPFCSRRCADVDLGRWLTGGYAIPADDADENAVPDADQADTLDDARDTPPKSPRGR